MSKLTDSQYAEITALLTTHKDKGEGIAQIATENALIAKGTDRPEAESLVAAALARHAAENPRGKRASKIRRARRKWLWTDRVPLGVLTNVFGEEGIGKGNVTVWLAAQASRGLLPGELHGTPARVAFVSFEDDPSIDLVPRLIANGADLDMIDIYAEGDDYESPLSLPSGLPAFEAELVKGEVKLLVIDPLPDALDEHLKDNNNKDVRAALVPLQQLAKRLGIAIIGVTHPNKGHTSAANKIMGSKAFRSVPRMVLMLGINPKDPNGESRVLAVNKRNGTASKKSIELKIRNRYLGGCELEQDEDGFDLGDTPYVEVVGDSDVTDQEMIAFGVTGKTVTADVPTTQSERARDLIIALLDVEFGEVQARTAYSAGESVGISEKTMRRARADLQVKEDSGTWYVEDDWSPPLRF